MKYSDGTENKEAGLETNWTLQNISKDQNTGLPIGIAIIIENLPNFLRFMLEECHENRLPGHIALPLPLILVDIYSEYEVEEVLDVKH